MFADPPRLIPYGCYTGPTSSPQPPPQLPHIVSASGTDTWSLIVDPLRNPEGPLCFDNRVRNYFVGLLLFLLVLICPWSYIILKVTLHTLSGGIANDLRSHDDEKRDRELGADSNGGEAVSEVGERTE